MTRAGIDLQRANGMAVAPHENALSDLATDVIKEPMADAGESVAIVPSGKSSLSPVAFAFV